VDVLEPLALSAGACLDVLAATGRQGAAVWIVRPHGVDDTFKHASDRGGTFCGRPIADWLRAVGVGPHEVWDADVPASERTLWNARVFPAVAEHRAYRDWLWYHDVEQAAAAAKRAFVDAERYSAAEAALAADQDAFHQRRMRIASRDSWSR
jgi:hypothetical protein